MMDQTVALLVAAVCLFGIGLGLRFRVYVLISASLVVLIVSAMTPLIWKKMAGWGVLGTLGLLVLLNAGFTLGLPLRAAAASWSTHRIAGLFAYPINLDQPTRRPDGAGREASSEGAGPTAAIAARDLAKESFRR